jgi:hypothetical protein
VLSVNGASVKTVLLFLLLAATVQAAVVRLAPEFTFPGPGNKTQALRSLRGQPVVLLVADSPKTKAFRKQLKLLRGLYQEFASRKAVFVAAFKNGDGAPVASDIPFALATNGPAVAAAYGVTTDFSLIVIGKDANVDYQTPLPRPGDRIRDLIQNSYEVQAASRKEAPGN